MTSVSSPMTCNENIVSKHRPQIVFGMSQNMHTMISIKRSRGGAEVQDEAESCHRVDLKNVHESVKSAGSQSGCGSGGDEDLSGKEEEAGSRASDLGPYDSICRCCPRRSFCVTCRLKEVVAPCLLSLSVVCFANCKLSNRLKRKCFDWAITVSTKKELPQTNIPIRPAQPQPSGTLFQWS